VENHDQKLMAGFLTNHQIHSKFVAQLTVILYYKTSLRQSLLFHSHSSFPHQLSLFIE